MSPEENVYFFQNKKEDYFDSDYHNTQGLRPESTTSEAHHPRKKIILTIFHLSMIYARLIPFYAEPLKKTEDTFTYSSCIFLILKNASNIVLHQDKRKFPRK